MKQINDQLDDARARERALKKRSLSELAEKEARLIEATTSAREKSKKAVQRERARLANKLKNGE